MKRFAIGDRVRRMSLRGWRTGIVVCEVPPLMNPMKIFRKWHNAGGGEWKGSNAGWVARDDWSYIVQDGLNFYWPRTAMLEPCGASEAGGAVIALVLAWAALAGLCGAFWWYLGRAILSCSVSY